MKLLLVLILFLTRRLCYGLKDSKHYKFKYFSNFKTGIPYDGNQVSGLSMKALLDVYLENTDGIAILKLSNLTTAAFDEDLGCNQKAELPDDRFIPPENKEFLSALEQSFRVNLRGSEPFSIEYEETEHRWLSNFRKGLASVFKNEILKGNFDTQEKDSISSLFHQGHFVNSFSVEEETIFGICKVNYQIHELTDESISTHNDFLPYKKSDDSNDAFWNIIRSVDFDACKEKVTFHTSTTNEERNKEEKLMFSRSSVSTYVLRGSPGNFDLYGADVEGLITFPLSYFDEQEAQVTTKQKFILIAKDTHEEIPTLGPNLSHSTTWMNQIWSSFKLPKDSKPLPWIVYSNDNSFRDAENIHGSQKIGSESQILKLKTLILETIETASNILTDINYETNETQWRNITDSLSVASFYIKIFTKEDIITLFDQIFKRDRKLERRLIIDAAAASGSHNAFEAILDYISNKELEPFEIRNVFMTLSASEGTLNITRLLDYVMQVNPKENSEGPAVFLNFAAYLSEFCIHKAHNYYPGREPFYEDCDLITQRFILHLKEMIYNETLTWERTFAVRVLEQLRSYFSFEILAPLIDGRMKSFNQLKTMALRALKNWAPDRDQKKSVLRKPVMDLLKDVYTDFNQYYQARAAALVSYISWQPSTSFWYDLAHSTWHEPLKDYSEFATNLIKLYAEEKFPAPEKQWRDASSALKFAKSPVKHEDDMSSSFFDIFSNNYVKSLVLFMNRKNIHTYGEILVDILTKNEDLSLIKFESYDMYEKREWKLNDSIHIKHDHLPKSKEFFDNFSKEIKLDFHRYIERHYYQVFFQLLGGAPGTMPPQITWDPINFIKDGNVSYGGRYVRFFQKTDFIPNELGLPTIIFSEMPTSFSITTKRLPKETEHTFASQGVLRASAVYSRGALVFTPWDKEDFIAVLRSSLEVTLPVGHIQEKHSWTERSVRSTKSHYSIAFEKKFPVFRLSNTPMTAKYNLDPDNENQHGKVQLIKKSDLKEKVISEIDPFFGIKYDLVMQADTKAPFGLHHFLQFPKIPFNVWNFELYLNPEESDTKKLLLHSTEATLAKSKEASGISTDSSQESLAISFNDTFIERSEKLTRMFGGSIGYTVFKYNLVGKKDRNYEAFYVESKESGGPSRRMVGFTTSREPENTGQPISFCIDFRKKSPSPAERDAAFISQRNISQEAELKFLFNCYDPVLKVHALYSMSNEGRVETTGNCNSKYDNTEFNPKLKLFFDNIDVNVSYVENLKSYDFGVTKDVYKYLRHWIDFPSFKRFSHETQKGNIGFKIQRNSYHKNWDLHVNTSYGDALLGTFKDTSLFRFLSGVSQYVPQSLLDAYINDFGFSSAKCTLQGNSVTTFNGAHYSYQPSTCWTLVSYPYPIYSFRMDNNVFLIRASKGSSNIPDFKYILYDLNVEIEFSNNELKVNGTVVDRISDDSPELKTIVEDIIYKSGRYYLIYSRGTNKMVTVVVGIDKIEIYNENVDAPMLGICGNYDGKSNPEFIGPKRCVYNNTQMFTASWTGQSDSCDTALLEEYRKGVDDFQDKCEPFLNQPQDFHMNQRCFYFAWKILTSNESLYCISIKPLPFCLKSCHTQQHKTIKVTYKCWPKEKAPESLRTSAENKIEIVTTPVAAHPYSYEHSYTEIATICKQF